MTNLQIATKNIYIVFKILHIQMFVKKTTIFYDWLFAFYNAML